MMGGAAAIMARARTLHDAGEYMLAIEILNKLVLAEPDNVDGREMLADAFEQVGYQQENPGLRNSFLSGAYELRSGEPTAEAQSSSGPDIVRAMSTELWLNFLGIQMDSRLAEGLAFTINLSLPDVGESFVVEMSNATLTNIAGFQAEAPDLSLTLNRSTLEKIMMGQAAFEELIAAGEVTFEGDISILGKLAALMVPFDPRFEVMPGTAGRDERAEAEGTLTATLGAVAPE
jgi:alkyl sulfatase BDS1-like metallo-beta-lactamase superfamily hydrolase